MNFNTGVFCRKSARGQPCNCPHHRLVRPKVFQLFQCVWRGVKVWKGELQSYRFGERGTPHFFLSRFFPTKHSDEHHDVSRNRLNTHTQSTREISWRRRIRASVNASRKKAIKCQIMNMWCVRRGDIRLIRQVGGVTDWWFHFSPNDNDHYEGREYCR